MTESADRTPPQPSAERLTDFAGASVVVGVVPGQSDLVIRTAASLAHATGGTLFCAFVDESRYTETEQPDGTVDHRAINPDTADDWQPRDATIRTYLAATLDPLGVRWEFRYLAGRIDRALTHLARAVDASCFVVGAKTGSPGLRDFLDHSVGVRLAHHQHRPVLVVPVAVVDWNAPTPWQWGDPEAAPARPPHLQPANLGLVFAGGVVGTAARAGLAHAMPHTGAAWPWSTFLVNITGAFALGLLLEWLSRLGRDEGRRRAIRLMVGTGLIGSYTTYSTFAVDIVALSRAGAGWTAVEYAVASVVAGVLAALAGIWLARWVRR